MRYWRLKLKYLFEWIPVQILGGSIIWQRHILLELLIYFCAGVASRFVNFSSNRVKLYFVKFYDHFLARGKRFSFTVQYCIYYDTMYICAEITYRNWCFVKKVGSSFEMATKLWVISIISSKTNSSQITKTWPWMPTFLAENIHKNEIAYL